MTKSTLYAVTYGVDSRHLHESGGVFSLLREAQERYATLPLQYPLKAKRIERLVFETPYAPATKVEIVKEVVA